MAPVAKVHSARARIHALSRADRRALSIHEGNSVDDIDTNSELDEEFGAGPRYRAPADVSQSELRDALNRLQLFGDDVSMRVQAFNLALVDECLMKMELDLLQQQFSEEQTLPQGAVLLSAFSQMWIFAAYELMRTWRQRATEIVKWEREEKLHSMLDYFQDDIGYPHVGRLSRAAQIKRMLDDPANIEGVKADLRRTQIPFIRLEAIRVSIAKHELRRQKGSVAMMPIYGRINRWCGSLDFELENGVGVFGTISRRDIADDIRALPHAEIPTDEQLKSFEEFMRGPPPPSS